MIFYFSKIGCRVLNYRLYSSYSAFGKKTQLCWVRSSVALTKATNSFQAWTGAQNFWVQCCPVKAGKSTAIKTNWDICMAISHSFMCLGIPNFPILLHLLANTPSLAGWQPHIITNGNVHQCPCPRHHTGRAPLPA